jgi:hypothetical protein
MRLNEFFFLFLLTAGAAASVDSKTNGAEVRLVDLRKFKDGANGKLSRSRAEERDGGN